MSKKKLVVSGDSWTAPAYAGPRRASYIDGKMKRVVPSGWINIKPEIIFWPEYLGEMLNMDVVNVGLSGVGLSSALGSRCAWKCGMSARC